MYRQRDRETERRSDGATERGRDGETAKKKRFSLSPSLRRSVAPSLRLLRILLPFALIATNACLLKASRPDLPAIFPAPIVAKQTGKTPIIIIPGVTGSELVNRTTGEKLWPDLFPEDKRALALPIT